MVLRRSKEFLVLMGGKEGRTASQSSSSRFFFFGLDAVEGISVMGEDRGEHGGSAEIMSEGTAAVAVASVVASVAERKVSLLDEQKLGVVTGVGVFTGVDGAKPLFLVAA